MKVENYIKLIFFSLLYCLTSLPQANQRQIQCKVVGISDGDTLTCLHQHNRLKIRLNDIDVLESRQSQQK